MMNLSSQLKSFFLLGLNNVPFNDTSIFKSSESSLLMQTWIEAQRLDNIYFGPALVQKLCGFFSDAKRAGLTQLTDEQYYLRLKNIVDYAKLLFANKDLVGPNGEKIEAVIAYGSYIRGKNSPTDIDLRIVTTEDQSGGDDYMYPTMCKTEEQITKIIENYGYIPKTIDGNNIHFIVDSTFNTKSGFGIPVAINSGPFMVLVPSEPIRSTKQIYPIDGIQVYAYGSTDGRDYLEYQPDKAW